MKKIQGKSGKWYKVSQFESCCDCGLCHQKEYKVTIKGNKAEIYFRAWRHKGKTKANRKITPKKLKERGFTNLAKALSKAENLQKQSNLPTPPQQR